MKMKLSTLVSFSLALSLNAFAQSNSGNGGSLVHTNGMTQIADPFVRSTYANPSMQLSTEMQKILHGFNDVLERRGILGTEFFKNSVFSDLIEYVYAAKLPCSDTIDLVTLDGSTIEDYACTYKGITYVLKNKFETLTPRDQALGILHERLHAKFPEAAHHWITGLVAGLRRVLELKDLQLANHRDPLSARDLELLGEMDRDAARIGLPRAPFEKMILPNGGGVIFFDKEFSKESPREAKNEVYDRYTSSDNFIGVTSSIALYYSGTILTLKSAILLNTKVRVRGSSTSSGIIDSFILDSELAEIRISKSYLVSTFAEISDFVESRIEKTRLSYSQVSNSHVLDSVLDKSEIKNDSNFFHCSGFFNADHARCENVQTKPNAVGIKLDAGSSLINLRLSSGFVDHVQIILSRNTEVSELNLRLQRLVPTDTVNRISDLELTFNSNTQFRFDPKQNYSINLWSFLNIFGHNPKLTITSVENLVSDQATQGK